MVLYLFCGLLRKDGGDAFARALAERIGVEVEVEMWDILNDPGQDLCDDTLWSRLLGKVKAGRYAAVFMSPPCSTFSGAANWSAWWRSTTCSICCAGTRGSPSRGTVRL